MPCLIDVQPLCCSNAAPDIHFAHTHTNTCWRLQGVLTLVDPVERHTDESHSSWQGKKRRVRKDRASSDSSDSESTGAMLNSILGSIFASPPDTNPLFTSTQVNRLRKQGLDGAGVLVCVVDTGGLRGDRQLSQTQLAMAL